MSNAETPLDNAEQLDAILIERAVAGHSECFSLLINRHLTVLKRRLAGMISNEADLEDTLQEVILKVWQHLAAFRGEANIRTWMTRVAINQARQLFRRDRTRPACVPLDHFRDFRAPDELQDKSIMKQQALAGMLEALQQLPPKYRDALTLRDLQGV